MFEALVSCSLPLLGLGKGNGGILIAVNALGGADAKAGWDPKVTEDATGVEDGHGGGSEDDKGALEDHEGEFVVREMGVEATPELGNTVDAADEDERSGNEQACLNLAIGE